MKKSRFVAAIVVVSMIATYLQVEARGFGGSRGGGSYSGSRGSYSGSRSSSYGYGDRGGGYGSSSYDRSYSDSRGGSVDASGSRGFASNGYGGYAGGSSRDVTATTANGRTYSSDSQRGFAGNQYGAVAGGSRYGGASGPNGEVAGGSRWGGAADQYGAVAGGSRYGAASGEYGAAAGGSRWGAGAERFPTDAGMSRYSAFGATGAAGAAAGRYGTSYWSHGAMATTAGAVRGGFGYYNTFNSGWYGTHPGAWGAAVGWAAGNAWATPAWSTIGPYVGVAADPVNYDYGTNVVYQGDNVYVDGTSAGTADQYAQQATTLATQGQQATPPPQDQWQSLGVFALVQGQETSSNTVFQLAVDQSGVMRGNYYDGLMDTTTPIYGSVDKQSQRAAWTIGDKKNRVFEAGIVNLTKDQTPVLIHIGGGKTQQWMLVRMQQPQSPTQN